MILSNIPAMPSGLYDASEVDDFHPRWDRGTPAGPPMRHTIAACFVVIVLFMLLSYLLGCSARQEIRGGETRITHTESEKFLTPVRGVDGSTLGYLDANDKFRLPEDVLRDPGKWPANAGPQLIERTRKTEAVSTGASGKQSGTEADLAINQSPARLEVPGLGKAAGGGLDASGSVIGGIPVGQIICGLGGLACLGVAAFGVYRQRLRLAVIAGVLGIVLVACCFEPALAVFGGVAAALAVVAYLFWFIYRETREEKGRDERHEGARAYVEALVKRHGRDEARRMVESYADRKTDLDLFDSIVKADDLRKAGES